MQPRLALTILLAAMMLITAAPALAQRDRDRDDERWDDAEPLAPAMPEELDERPEPFAEPKHRPGLFREGSHLLEVPATVRKDEESGAWIATLHLEDTARQRIVPRDMRLMPSAFLGELQRVIELTPEQRITFSITGETFIFERENYLLLRAPARVIALERKDNDGVAEAERARASEDAPSANQRGPRTAAEIMRDLERSTGPLHRAPARPRSGIEEEPAFREGTLLIHRRGRISRDGGGAWMFIFDADAHGQADPPLTLMPCLLLERIVGYARRFGPTAPILISGQVFVHENRAYLLPSTYQLPREQTPLGR